jgi:hypothetical protein
MGNIIKATENNIFTESFLEVLTSDTSNLKDCEGVAEYFIDEFDSDPEEWDSVFTTPYEKLSDADKNNRREVLLDWLVKKEKDIVLAKYQL